jgi:hypothetical protein
MPDEFNPDAVRNPSSGLLARNPTHIQEAKDADDQSDIVNAIKQSGVKRMRIRHDYTDVDKSNPPPLVGVLKIRDMTEEAAVNFCKNLMRSRPNIFTVHIKLGDYPNARRLDNSKTRMLNANKARFNTEVGAKMGEILADRNMNVTELKYIVSSAEPGRFDATSEVYGTTQEEYFDDEHFKPVIEFEFIKTT